MVDNSENRITNHTACHHLATAIYEMAELLNRGVKDNSIGPTAKRNRYAHIVSACKAHETLCDFDTDLPIEVHICADATIKILSVDIY